MHKYLKAIGFSDITKSDLNLIMKSIIDEPDLMCMAKDSEGNELIEFTGEIAPGIGLAVRGYYNEEDEFEVDYYAPYINGDVITTREEIEVEKHADKESYAGICDDQRIGLTLIFYVNNVIPLLENHGEKLNKIKLNGAALSGLSSEGKILLPIEKGKEKAKTSVKRQELLAQAKDGDEDAMQEITLQDLDTYTLIGKRVHNEDLMSIISTYFMPFGVESDQYGILAEIMQVKEVTNNITGEKVYIMKVKCNDMTLDICINKNNLMGEPKEGRRFKGDIWLQGNVLL